jgi:IS66 Orf2 like protein
LVQQRAIYLGVDAIDMRKGFNGLYGVVRDQFGHDQLSGHLFLFTNRSRTRMKALVGAASWQHHNAARGIRPCEPSRSHAADHDNQDCMGSARA